MSFDLVLRNARIVDRDDPLDIGIADGCIAALAPNLPGGGEEEDLAGRLTISGFVETHIHLDKSCLLDRCPCRSGTLREAVASVAEAKRGFTVEDVTARATRTLERAIVQGTTRMRTHVEVDPRVGLTSFEALTALKRDYRWAVDLTLCVFPQEGLTNNPGCEDLLAAALNAGADAIGGAPYIDPDPAGQLARIFALARAFDVDIDLHLDFDLDPAGSDMVEVCRLTDAYGWGGRVAIGHVTKLSALPPGELEVAARRLADAGIALTVLPATDLYLGGRDRDHLVPRGVAPAHRLAGHGIACSIATNNVLNPFTPFGDASLLRMANLYANVAQLGSDTDMRLCFDMVTAAAARLLRLDGYGIAVGRPADLVVLDCESPEDAVREIAQPLLGLKAGRRSFVRPSPSLLPPL
ncbi:amidohydrolase family protein [Labrys wisconsinensis]|uniref:Cytosine deaminase n=1 Tax=Labrys wisconsinensis TaxID=425677 RepID=A0ABU0J4Q1_9HYPH|nr:amidohydrolase family protein [Labrys wisconsinensis]MDQ0469241.1 cytosine deaminase [Labrys wisconsinensis]